MERMTKAQGEGYILSDGYSDEIAIQRLGRYETAHEELTARQVQVEQELEKLRAEGRQKTDALRS